MATAAPPDGKLSLSDLLPEKIPVQTSLGFLYVRRADGSDWTAFEGNNPDSLGQLAVQRLVNSLEDKRDNSPLTNEEFESLANGEVQVLAAAVARHNDWGDVSPGSALQELGSLAKDAATKAREELRQQAKQLRRSLGASYKFLEKGPLDKLSDQVARLSVLRGNPAAENLQNSLKVDMPGVDALKRAVNPAGITQEAVQPFGRAALQIPRPPRPEDTPLGRAAMESAQHSREIASQMGALAEVVGGLNQTLVTDVLPAWFKQVESDQQQAKAVFEQAAANLRVTKYAVVISVFVSVVLASWQIYITKEMNEDSTTQQTRIEGLLRDQRALQKAIVEQQERAVQQLRESAKERVEYDAQLRSLIESMRERAREKQSSTK